ncbi:DUF4349 domain-containing protein [Nocardioides sp. MH1]|uniref:DUF4349 domain-containing protein n=1 Tax=Nocardioides sp. MH1 TaxID=3242490 RepID=UPI003521BA8A
MRLAARPSRLLLPLVAVFLAASGCASSGGDSDDKGSSAGFAETTKDAPKGAPHRSTTDELNGTLSYADADSLEVADRPGEVDAQARKVIAKGDVALESDDVEAAVGDVEDVVRHFLGEITERETSTDDDGDVSDARLLVRIPVDDFDEAFVALQGVADLKSSNTGKEDVTTKVIDTKVRIRAQRLSLARVEALFDRAQSISDIIRIESQVSRRQAELESLERRLHYLSNQTSMSTITVSISLPPAEPGPKKDKKKEPEEAGFLAGLSDGWHAFTDFATGLATLSGRVLPFAAVLLVIGGPLWLALRRFRRREGGAAPGPTSAEA